MSKRLVTRLGTLAAILLVCTAQECSDAVASISGCKIEARVGSWGAYYSDADFRISPIFNGFGGTEGCPVPIVQPGERVEAAAVIYDHDPRRTGLEKTNRRARLRLLDSRNQVLNQASFASNYFDTSVRTFEVYGSYRAATGLMTLSDKDFMEIQITETPCCLPQQVALIELRLDYGADGSYRINLAGKQIPYANTSETWSVTSPSGGHPHTYTWYHNGTNVGQAQTYSLNTGSSDFSLRVDGVDVYGRQATTAMEVDVDGVRVTQAGPSVTYASQGGGTWTASGTGGYTPYTFQWYVDDAFVGSGTSWQGYPGEGERILKVIMTDARGAKHYVQSTVTGLGSGDGTCDPVPPQFTCEV